MRQIDRRPQGRLNSGCPSLNPGCALTPCLCALAASLLVAPQPPGGQPGPVPPGGRSGYPGPGPGFWPGGPQGAGPLPAPLQATILEFQRLTAEVGRLRDENARLRAEVERLRRRPVVADRFRDRGDHVEDTKTGLLWQKDGSAAGQLNYFDAHKYAVGLKLGGVAGWRLPTRAELAAIYPAADPPFENTQHNPEQPDGPGGGPMPSYWTGDLDTRQPDYAYVYHWYGAGGANNCYASSNRAWVRCVHDPLAGRPKGPPSGSGAGGGPVFATPAAPEPPAGVSR